jgi:hypothetical protein
MESVAATLQQGFVEENNKRNSKTTINSDYLFVRKITNTNSEKSCMLTVTGKFFLMYVKFLSEITMCNNIAIHSKKVADETGIPEKALLLEVKHLECVGVLKRKNTLSQKEATYEFYDPLEHDFISVVYQN